MIRLNIVAWHNGGGLSHDVDIIIAALPTDRFEVTLNGSPYHKAKIRRHRISHRAHGFRQRWLHPKTLAAAPYDINLFWRILVPRFFKYASVNAFIPNPEWFRKSQYRHLEESIAFFAKPKVGRAYLRH